MKRSVVCTRASTAEQDRSGLELDAQREAIQDFARREGFEILEFLQDIETGKSTLKKQVHELRMASNFPVRRRPRRRVLKGGYTLICSAMNNSSHVLNQLLCKRMRFGVTGSSS
jgi:hypothetical protein